VRGGSAGGGEDRGEVECRKYGGVGDGVWDAVAGKGDRGREVKKGEKGGERRGTLTELEGREKSRR
jgi:hypothetical protein